jgi:hypothetical protein
LGKESIIYFHIHALVSSQVGYGKYFFRLGFQQGMSPTRKRQYAKTFNQHIIQHMQNDYALFKTNLINSAQHFPSFRSG